MIGIKSQKALGTRRKEVFSYHQVKFSAVYSQVDLFSAGETNSLPC